MTDHRSQSDGDVRDVDVLVAGGGVAGLWTLAALRAAGVAALLVESDRLGAGQTIAAQGIIHGGTKYALGGAETDASEAVRAMPDRWRGALAGTGAVDLRGCRVAAPHQFLWSADGIVERLTGLLGRHVVRARAEVVGPEHGPRLLRDPAARGTRCRLDEMVLDVASLLERLRAPSLDALVRGRLEPAGRDAGDGRRRWRLHPPDDAAAGSAIIVRPRLTVLAAGARNADLLDALAPDRPPAMQRRPLHMVLVRGADLPEDTFLHVVRAGTSVPRLTITSHRDRAGTPVWYLGGGLAEDGTAREPDELARQARTELETLFPWRSWSGLAWSAFRIDRAEGAARGGRRPDGPVVDARDDIVTTWPTKLAFAPRVADTILQLLDVQVRGDVDATPVPRPTRPDGFDAPEVAPFPWDEEDRTWFDDDSA